MNYARDQHSIVFHYADGVADILGLSTAQQLAIRTAMHLALRELATGYEATAADMATQIELLRNELREAESVQQQDTALPALLANVKTSQAPVVIHTNGTQPTSISAGKTTHQVTLQAPAFDSQAAHEASAAETQPDPTMAATKPAANDRKPFKFTWGMLDDTSLKIARNLDVGRGAWRVVNLDDKRVIALAVIKELQLELPPGETLTIAQYDQQRPIWMPSFPSLSTGVGMTWKQMLAAAAD
jgi:hypothetical protein